MPRLAMPPRMHAPTGAAQERRMPNPGMASHDPPVRLLVVDDSPDAADTTAELLRLDGYDVAVAYDGAQAVEVAARSRPRLVLMDITMPALDGYSAARELRRIEPREEPLVLVALTSRATPEEVDRAIDAGFDLHLPKPLFGQALSEVVDALVKPGPTPAEEE